MAGGGGEGKTWIGILVGGTVLCGAGYGLELGHLGPHWLAIACLAVGGLGVVFGSCEAMIKCVEGVGEKLNWNKFVAGTIAGLASNIPEIVMLGFVVAAAPRVAFVVVALTLHVNALVFAAYSGLLPRDRYGEARLPEPLVKISTDLYAAGGGVMLATGSLMVLMKVFHSGEHGGEGFNAWDLYAVGVCLMLVQATATTQMVKRFSANPSADGDADPGADDEAEVPAESATKAKKAKKAKRKGSTGSDEDGASQGATGGGGAGASWGAIAGYGALGIVTSLLGGHAVGDFADALVGAMNDAGYPEMVGAIILSVFAGAGAFVMVASAHAKGMYDIALAGVSGSITQVPFLVLPAVMILMALLAQLGVTHPSGPILVVDLETTSVILLAFPPLLLMWKSIQDDGKVNWVETAGMVAVFGLTIYFLALHG